MPDYEKNFEQIQGIINLKNVYYFFPNYIKCVILFFQGTSEHPSGWINRLEGRSFENYGIANNYGIIGTDAEETTQNQDLINKEN